MSWLKKIDSWYVKKEEEVFEPEELLLEERKLQTIDITAEEVDPDQITIANAYKTRWIWYHTILAIGIFFTNCLLIAILLLLAIKL
jgi:hypothetical protein